MTQQTLFYRELLFPSHIRGKPENGLERSSFRWRQRRLRVLPTPQTYVDSDRSQIADLKQFENIPCEPVVGTIDTTGPRCSRPR